MFHVLIASAVQPFNLNRDGSLTPISGPVGSGQIAVCWITVSGQNVYTTNYLTNDITSYTAGRQGSLTLNAPVAGGAVPGMTPLVTPIDQALSPDGQFLYQPHTAQLRLRRPGDRAVPAGDRGGRLQLETYLSRGAGSHPRPSSPARAAGPASSCRQEIVPGTAARMRC